ncbi:hypothetical protein HKBW3S33_01981 [Candidatus Hakubella thermalkaliphila]|uniref:Transposase n=2 Tax=Candidatus Hakubella thermalkaliphila TaxID=2754717 RepID=A0A6V8P8B7_9ACTN|nr:hypothetical protein HKBW3S33_01981 [Candidatus Hakubella thermalkaliphila]
MSELTGLSRPTILKGMKELKSGQDLSKIAEGKIRKEGGGRKRLTNLDSALVKDLTHIMDENTAGDPMSLLKWTGKSTRKIADEMVDLGHPMSAMSVCRMLKEMGYSLQANVKTKEGKEHPDRDAQFKYINEQVKDFIKNKAPVVSVDTKKKENVGELKKAPAVMIRFTCRFNDSAGMINEEINNDIDHQDK